MKMAKVIEAYAVVKKHEGGEGLVIGIFTDKKSADEYIDELIGIARCWRNLLVDENVTYEIYKAKVEFVDIVERTSVFAGGENGV